MEILTREESGNLCDHVLHELERLLFTGAHHDVFHAPDDTRCALLTFAREFGVGSDSGHLMARQLDFRYDCDETISCVFHDLLDLLLGVETTVFRSLAVDAL